METSTAGCSVRGGIDGATRGALIRFAVYGKVYCMVRFSTILLAGLMVGAAAGQTPAAEEQHEHKVKVPSSTLTVTAAGKSTKLTLADLQSMPQRTVMVHNGHSNVDETYTGVGLSDLLAKFGLTLENGGAKQVYHSYVRAEGTDHYFVLFSATELEDKVHTGDALIALTVDGKLLTEDGRFKMVLAGEKRPARWVTNLSSLSIVTVQ